MTATLAAMVLLTAGVGLLGVTAIEMDFWQNISDLRAELPRPALEDVRSDWPVRQTPTDLDRRLILAPHRVRYPALIGQPR